MTFNEWNPLKKVVVGIADYAKIPPLSKGMHTVNYADKIDLSSITVGLYPQPVSYTHLRAHETPEHRGCRGVL